MIYRTKDNIKIGEIRLQLTQTIVDGKKTTKLFNDEMFWRELDLNKINDKKSMKEALHQILDELIDDCLKSDSEK